MSDVGDLLKGGDIAKQMQFKPPVEDDETRWKREAAIDLAQVRAQFLRSVFTEGARTLEEAGLTRPKTFEERRDEELFQRAQAQEKLDIQAGIEREAAAMITNPPAACAFSATQRGFPSEVTKKRIPSSSAMSTHSTMRS